MQSGGTVTSPSASVDVHLRRSSIAAGCNDELYMRQNHRISFFDLTVKEENISERTNARRQGNYYCYYVASVSKKFDAVEKSN